MSTAERRTKYVSGRILIEAERILVPQFVAQGIFLSGAQVELLRNVVAYLGRDTTFVDEYHGGYYLTVTEEDWDDIQAIVADLEDKLMANDNTIWGYNSRLAWLLADDSDDAGTFVIPIGPVPSDEVWVVENAMIWHNQGASITAAFILYADAATIFETPILTVPTGTWYGGPTYLTLGQGDSFQAYFWGLDVGKTAQFSGSGYKMKVPE